MINNVILVGRLTADPEVRELESGIVVCNITLAVTRSFKNISGESEVDFIRCSLWEGIANVAGEYCKKGSMVGIKGRLISKDNFVILEGGESKNIKSIEVVAERISLIKT